MKGTTESAAMEEVELGARHYTLRCQGCDAVLEDDGLLLGCPRPHESALLISDYAEARFEPDTTGDGIFRYRRWLPSARTLPGSGSSATYRSDALSRILGMRNVWVVFNGYWPEKGASLETGTFKDLEAWAVLSRLPMPLGGILVLASAGNTAAAFAAACSANRVPCLIIIPEAGLPGLLFADALDPCVKIVSLVGFTDYSDAIVLANRVSALEGFVPEGGVRNVGRRDGLGTTVLNAVEVMGQLPAYYFQAVGSGAGGIAAHEAAQRLVADGRFGDELPRLMLSQNLPFAPMYIAWKSGRRELAEIDADDGRKQIQQIAAHVLSNRQPPYGIRGGVYDVLSASGGDMLVADNLEALPAQQLFEDVEGIDIDPASAVAFATLLKASRSGLIDKDAQVLLNVTGGGRHRRQVDQKLVAARPALQLDQREILLDETLERITGLFS